MTLPRDERGRFYNPEKPAAERVPDGVEVPLQAIQVQAQDMLLAYCMLMDPAYEAAPHVRVIIDHLQALERGEIRRLMIFMPPRHGKSYHTSERFPAWYLGRNPSHRVILASYAATLAEANSRTVRNLLEDERNPFRMRLAPDSRAVGRWETTAGGYLLAAGVGGGINGFGANLLDIDDPFAGRAEADSQLIRDNVWVWYQETARTRLMPGGKQLITQTRWHEDDLAGRLLNSRGASDWAVVSLSAIAEDVDILGRQPGEALWPTRYPISELPSVEKGEISPTGFSALYQQHPTPAGGGVFKMEWMNRRFCTCGNPESCGNPPLPFTRRTIQTVDIGGKQGVGHDPSAIATWASDGISFYLVDYWSSQAEYADIKPVFATKFFEQHARTIFVEDATWAQPLISDLRRETGINVRPWQARGSKWIRADGVAPVFQAGRVVLPERAPWLQNWIHEHVAFPNGAHDEAVDTTSMALTELREFGTVLTRHTIGGRLLARSAV